MKTNFDKLLELSVSTNASDIHVSSVEPPYFRRQGSLDILTETEWPQNGLAELLPVLLSERELNAFNEERSLDLAYSLPGGDRFRLNLYHERNLPALAVRRLNDSIQDYESLHLPKSLDQIPKLHNGLVLITGPTGSGKSTTLAATIDQINKTKALHIITIEDPIEQLHQSKRSLIHQRQLYRDVPSFFQGVKDALREDPDILLVGEMRDRETMKAAITAAETGHLVFSTLHTGDAVGTINRILGGFTAEEQRTLRHQLSMVLRAVVAQTLVPTKDNSKRIPIVEVLWATKPVCNHIRTGRLEQIYSIMESGIRQGMLTREHSLADHVHNGLIDLDEALRLARDPKALTNLLELREEERRQALLAQQEAEETAEFAVVSSEPTTTQDWNEIP